MNTEIENPLIEKNRELEKLLALKNRQLEIEAAVERVRARTMAMQHSDELAEASFLLDQQVRALGINTWGCAFNIYREKDSIEWFGNEAGPTGKGTGLGLSLSYDIVTKGHGGKLRVKTQEGGGSDFIVEIPIM
jgi:hypothetical protein